MPFKTTDELRRDPAVKIFFSGQMIIQPDKTGDTCEVFVNRLALDHQFSVEVREKTPGRPDAVVMRHLGQLAFLPSSLNAPVFGMEITASNPKGLRMYTGTELNGGEDSLEHALDLTDERFHGQPLEIAAERARPSISLNDGILYTAAKSEKEIVITLEKRGRAIGKLPPIASVIGTNIYLDDDKETLTIRWLELGRPRGFELTKLPDGASYEVYILNEPLFVSPGSAAVHDELKDYYEILGPVPPEEQFKFNVDVSKAKRGTPGTLCMTGVKKRP